MGEIPETQMGKRQAKTGRTHGKPRRTIVAAGVATAWMSTLTTPAGAEVTYETRVLSGQPAPGTEPGVSFINFSTPTINDSGQTAFVGSFTNNRGIWSEAAGSIGSPELIAQSGDAAAGTPPGFNFTLFNSPHLNAAGQTAFIGLLAGTDVYIFNDSGIWSEAAGSIGSPGLVVLDGDAAPGTVAGVNFDNFVDLALNNAGRTAFRARLIGTGVDETNREGIWSEAAGSIGGPGLVARTGDAAPGTSPGVNFSSFSFDSLALSTAGHTAFRANLTGTGVDETNNLGIWSEAAGSIGSPGLIARTGDAAPGTSPGVNFSDLSNPAFNTAGQTAFRASLTGTGVDQFNAAGIWSEAAGSLGSPGLVAREGDAAPGTSRGVNFFAIASLQPAFNDAGQTAFVSFLTGPGIDGTNNSGIWSEGAGSIGSPALVARTGNPAPGTEPGVNFNSFFAPHLNNVGQTAFLGGLNGPDVDTTNNQGIWATDPDGLLTLIIRKGDLFDVDDDPLHEDFRTVALLNMHTSGSQESGGVSPFNNAGQLTFLATFTDGSSGIFVANTVAPILAGDYNGDGFVSQADLDLVLLNWGDTVLPGGFDADAIADGDPFDGLISQNELDGVLLNWGDGNPPNLNAIPEPSTVLFLASLPLLAGRGFRSWRSVPT